MPRPVSRHVSVRVVEQREDRDCAVACLAMLAALSYEDALRAVCSVDEMGASDGLYLTKFVEAASEVGIVLVPRRRFRPETAVGVMYYAHKKNENERHVNLVKRGVVFDTNRRVWLNERGKTGLEHFCRHYSYVAQMLLVEAA